MKRICKELLEKRIDSDLKNDISVGTLGAACAYVFQNGEVLYNKAFGYADTAAGTPVTEKTLYRMASMTKPVTAVAVMMLVEEGKLDIFDPIAKFLPKFASPRLVNGTPAKTVLRLYHLLSHTSGIGSGTVFDAMESDRKTSVAACTSLAAGCDFYAAYPLEFEPGSGSSYSPLAAFDILARIVEVVSGKSFDAFVAEKILLPLGMTDTTFLPYENGWARLTEMHDFKNGKKCLRTMPTGCVFENVADTYTCGGAGLVSSLSDYVKFAQMLLGEGTLDGVRILSPASVRSMALSHTNEAVVEGENDIFGLGVRVIEHTAKTGLPVGSFGWSGAYGTHFWVDPENRIAAVFMKNSAYDGGSGAMTAARFEEEVYSSMQ